MTRYSATPLLRLAGAFWTALLLAAAVLAARPSPLRGETGAHDPSRIVRCGDRYWVFCTGPGGINPDPFSFAICC